MKKERISEKFALKLVRNISVPLDVSSVIDNWKHNNFIKLPALEEAREYFKCDTNNIFNELKCHENNCGGYGLCKQKTLYEKAIKEIVD